MSGSTKSLMRQEAQTNRKENVLLFALAIASLLNTAQAAESITRDACLKRPRSEEENPILTNKPMLELNIRPDFVGSQLKMAKVDKEYKFSLGHDTVSMQEMINAINNGYGYTPLYRDLDLSTPAKIKKHFDDVNIETLYDQVYQISNGETKTITAYKFRKDNDMQRTAIAELIAYNKQHSGKEPYLIIDSDGPIRVRNPWGRDVLFEPETKAGGDGSKEKPYSFTSKNLSYKDMDDRLKANINLAERARCDFGGLLVMIGGENGGLQAPRGGAGYMRAFEDAIKKGNAEGNYDGYNTPVKNHVDGTTIGEVFGNQLARFINEKLPSYQTKAPSFKTLPDLIAYIIEEEVRLEHARARFKRSLKDEVANKENVKSPKGLTSGGNNLQFGPLKLFKKLSVALLSYVPNWSSKV